MACPEVALLTVSSLLAANFLARGFCPEITSRWELGREVANGLNLFKQLKELSVSGLQLNKNTHVYLWQHKAEYALLEWDSL